MPGIEEILHRRTDLSTFLVHLTRDHGGISARDRLTAIYDERVLECGSAMGWAADEDDPADTAAQSQRVVCFTETPLEHVWLMTQPIEGRRNQFAPYGVALPKYLGRKLGVNPVWYVDMTPGRDWAISEALNELHLMAAESDDFHAQPEARIFPFIEGMGVWPNRTKEFWWEREWRHVGSLYLPGDRCLFLCPEAEIDEFVQPETLSPRAAARARRQFIDPAWGLERIITHLAGIPKSDTTPFA